MSALLWRNCKFCLLAFKIFRSRIDQGRGKYCCQKCQAQGSIIEPKNAKIIAEVLRHRESIRKIVKSRGLDKRVNTAQHGRKI